MPSLDADLSTVPAAPLDVPNIATGTDARFLVSLSYQGFAPTKDKAMASLAKLFRGEFTGSGYFFQTGRRDLSLSFKTQLEAMAFIDAVPKRQGLRFDGFLYEADSDTGEQFTVQLAPEAKLLDYYDPNAPAKPSVKR